ncbi:copper resistance CopC family protein [Frankia sp. KB5]|uniref:copper resistance CopC family protein n=1 Tax=Frankia sp. KB5 TaxID=683318 RepID=UPI000A222928|nr:copper resistance CopC family protein [Frankia sp. KB5]ORT53451.1 hypothetical protein KBI5_06915 [Frankia sp. KB5]
MVLVLLGVLTCTLTATVPASAHSQLVASDPTDNAHLDTAPSVVTLRFSDGVLTIGTAVVVVDAAGTSWAEGEPAVSGQTVTTMLRDGPPDGAYQMRWRVVSADGHPISGVTRFTVGSVRAEPAVPVSATPVGSTPGTDDGPVGASPAASGPTATSPAGTPVAGAEAGGLPFRTALVGVGGALAALALLWAYGAIRRNSAPRGAETSTPEPSTATPTPPTSASSSQGNTDDIR